MMWLASLLVLAYVGGSYGEIDPECFKEHIRKCGEDSNIPDRFPESSEELLRACRQVEERASCIADVQERCDDDQKGVDETRQAVGYLSATCQEGNPIFEIISENLECLSEVGEKIIQTPCLHQFSEGTLEAAMEYVGPLIENKQHVHLMCLEELLTAGCRAMKFDRHCGDRVGAAMADVLWNLRTGGGKHLCTKEILEEIDPLLEGLGEVLRDEMMGWDKKRK